MYPAMSMLEVRRTTIADFEVMKQAYALSQVDRILMATIQAWQSGQVQATDKKGRPIYRKMKQLFDYERELERVRAGARPESGMKNRTGLELAAKANREVKRNRD